MVEEFPELRRVCGLALCTWGNDQHWWCAAPDGTVIDPTVSQFAAVFGYEELDPVKDRDKIPTGKCLDCGEAVFMGRTFCDETCERRTRAYLGC